MSRNYRVGLGLALNKDLNEILKDLGEVAEGIKQPMQYINYRLNMEFIHQLLMKLN